MKTTHSNHVYGIDILRFLAALFVVLFHFGTASSVDVEQYAPIENRAFPFLGSWTSFGWIGVQFFFVLSGYVISISAEAISWSRFLKSRAVRIFPVLWISSTISLIVIVATGGRLESYIFSWLRSMVLFPQGPYIDGVVWTLIVEAVFYILTAVVVAVSTNRGGYKKWKNPLAFALTMWSAIFLTCQLIATLYVPDRLIIFEWFGFTILLLKHGAFFALGMFISSLFRDEAARKWLPATIFAGSVCVFQLALIAPEIDKSIISIGIWLLLMAALVSWIKWPLRPKNDCVSRILLALGALSYPLYLGHFSIGMHLFPVAAKWITSPFFLFLIAMAAVLILAQLIANWPEKMLRRKLLNHLQFD